MRREGWRQRFDAVSGPVVKGSGKSASGHGYNPYRSGGKFASGPHKEKPKGPGRAPGAAAAKPKRAKFNAEPHKQVIAAHKALEAHHRGESLRLAGEMKALKKQAKATKPMSAERTSLKEQHAALKAQRDEHKTKATASRTDRIAASKEMQAAMKEHAATTRSTKESDAAAIKSATGAGPKKQDPVAEPRPAIDHQAEFAKSFVASKRESIHAQDSIDDVNHAQAMKSLDAARAHRDEMIAHGRAAKMSEDDINTHIQTINNGIDRATSEIEGREGRFFVKGEWRGEGGWDKRSPPEPGAMKAREYRVMATLYPAKLTPEQRVAVQDYSDHSDHILNPILRAARGKPDMSARMYEGGRVPAAVHTERLAKRALHDQEQGVSHDAGRHTVGNEIKNLDAAIAAHRFDGDVTAYRVISDPGGGIMGGLRPGSVFRDHGYVSTTADRNFLDDFHKGAHADRVDVHVTIKKGATGAPVGRLSAYGKEKEILLPRGSSFRVTRIVPASGKQAKQIHVETI